MEPDRDAAALIAMADGTLAETRGEIAKAADRERIARAALDEVAARTILFDGPATPVPVQFALTTGEEVLEFVLTVGLRAAAVERGRIGDPPVVIRQDLAELLRAVYGTAALPHDATRVLWLMNEPGPATDEPDDPWLRELRAATLAAGQVTSACSPYEADLGALARRFGSDKWGDHFYTSRYEQYFAPHRDQRITLLEIGVGGYEVPHAGGESLRMWKYYFRRGMIYGLDLFDKSPIDEPRIRTIRGDQADPAFLETLAGAIAPIDIAIDDGSHMSEHIVTSFTTLFPRLADGGLYVIEDLQTSYWAGWNGGRSDRNDPATTVGFLKRLVDALHHQDLSGAVTDAPALERSIRGVHLFHNLAIIEKGVNAEQPAPSWVRREQSDMDLTPKGSMRRVGL
jgi:demethylmacrocin O-methyltransferase